MASIFELENPSFGRLTHERTVLAGGDEATTVGAADCINSVVTVTPTAARTYTTATAALILTELGVNAKVGQTFELVVVNLAPNTHAITVAGGTGVTVTGLATVAHSTSGRFIGRVASSSTITLYRA